MRERKPLRSSAIQREDEEQINFWQADFNSGYVGWQKQIKA